MHIPLKFSQQHFSFNMNGGVVTLRVADGSVWSARYLSRRGREQHMAKFPSGWKQFLVDNDLHEGDICVFELIDKIQITSQVTIFRATKQPVDSGYLDQEAAANCKWTEGSTDIRTKTVCTNEVQETGT